MRHLVVAVGLAAALTTVPVMAADNAAACRNSLDGLVGTMRNAQPYHDPAHEKERLELLRQTQKTIADGRKQGVDECALWRQVSSQVATF